MRFSPRRNGGNNFSTRWKQSRESRNRDGHGESGFAGHHSYSKGRGGGNKVGAITAPNKEWSSKGRKEEEHLTGVARQAELDAVAEGLVEVVDYDPAEEAYRHYQDMLDQMSDELWEGAYQVVPTGVTIDGRPIWSDYDYGYDDYVDDRPSYCPCCGHRVW
jgi:hypothetical protein